MGENGVGERAGGGGENGVDESERTRPGRNKAAPVEVVGELGLIEEALLDDEEPL